MEKEIVLSEIAKKVSSCKKCDLWKGAIQPVPGEGNSNAEVVFVGEGPGFNEDKMGRPFVGRAGKLLDKILLLIGMERSEVFITNMIKHRPPENRDPLPTEIAACKGWLDQQLEVLKPKIIVTLGKHSLAKFLPKEKISLVHGTAVKIKGQVVIPMYHPAAALRNTGIFEKFKADFQNNASILKNPEKIGEVKELKSEKDDSDQISLF